MHPRQKNILRNKLCFTSKSIEGSTFWTPKELLCAEFSLNIETFVFADDHTVLSLSQPSRTFSRVFGFIKVIKIEPLSC